MNTLSIPVLIIASISFYVGSYHLLIYFRRRRYREDLTFALLCFTTVFYDAFCIGLYHATSVTEGMQWQRAQFIALAIFVPAFLWFVSDYTRQKPGKVIYAYSIYYILVVIVQLADRSSLTFVMDQPSIKHIVLSHVLTVTYYEVTPGPFSIVQGLIGVVASTYILIMGIRYVKRGHKREAIPLILAMGFVYVASFNDTMVSNGLYQLVYLIEYAYLAVILVMAYSLSNTVVEAAIAKEELRRSEEWFRSLVETTSDWVWEIDQSGIYTYASPKIYELLGYKPEEAIGKTPFELMSPEEAKRISVIFQNITTHQRPFERLENTALHKNGQLVVLETSGVPFFDANGKLLGYRGIDRDITERKRAEEALRQANLVVENSPAVLFRWGASEGWPVELVSKNVTQFGYTSEELLSGAVRFASLVHPQDLEQVVHEVQAYSASGIDHFQQEYRIITKEGKSRWVDDRTMVERDIDGRISHYQGIVIDITERKQAEAEREALIADLEAKNAELERFAYTVSHDLKSPLITIRGFLGFIEQDTKSGNMNRLKGDIQRISDATDKMQRLLNELLEISRIGRMRNELKLIPFEELAREAVELVQGRIMERGIEVHIDSNMPTVFGDSHRLLEVLQNLLDNAAKFMGDQSDPRIEIGQYGEDAERGKPVFFVKDNGIGIAPEHHERIFGLFNQLDPKMGGTGVGLAIVKRIVEFHGGRIWVESEAGKGATFFFTLSNMQTSEAVK